MSRHERGPWHHSFSFSPVVDSSSFFRHRYFTSYLMVFRVFQYYYFSGIFFSLLMIVSPPSPPPLILFSFGRPFCRRCLIGRQNFRWWYFILLGGARSSVLGGEREPTLRMTTPRFRQRGNVSWFCEGGRLGRFHLVSFYFLSHSFSFLAIFFFPSLAFLLPFLSLRRLGVSLLISNLDFCCVAAVIVFDSETKTY